MSQFMLHISLLSSLLYNAKCIYPCPPPTWTSITLWLCPSLHSSMLTGIFPASLSLTCCCTHPAVQCHLHLPAWYMFLSPLNVIPLPFSSLKQFYVLAWHDFVNFTFNQKLYMYILHLSIVNCKHGADCC